MESTVEPAPARLDRPALERLYLKLEKPMFNVVYRWLWNSNDAEEVMQEAFLRVWDARDRVDLATVEPLLYRTALNLASNRRRSAKLWRWIGSDAVDEIPVGGGEDGIAHAQEQARIRAAINALPERLKQVVLLTEYAELSYQQVGEALGIPAGTVGSRRSAALSELEKQLGDGASFES